jgi:hypothetical protein
MDLLAIPASNIQLCPDCGSVLRYIDATFFSLEGDRGWKIPLPVCPKCDVELNGLEVVSAQAA